MRNLIELLKSKNRCLRKIVSYSEEFIAQSGQKTREEMLDVVLKLERNRDTVIKTLDLIDRNITEAATLLPKNERTPEVLKVIDGLQQESVRWVHEILVSDQWVSRKIEELKSDISREMLNSKKQHDTLGKFKSTWVSESGTAIDKKL